MMASSSKLPQDPLRILLLGAGGREHALAHHLLSSPRVEKIFVAPGNGGTASLDRCENISVPAGVKGDWSEIVAWSKKNGINFVVPGPEQPLVDGAEKAFREVGIPVFGPSPIAAQMEGSKAFSKDFMARHQIPTAEYQTFTASQISECLAFIEKLGGAQSIVLKASGLAAGKGVILPESREEAEETVRDILEKKIFGDAGSQLLVETRLTGPELSVLLFSDGYSHVSLPPCQDHKRIGEGDTGPNTGGMGAYCPAPEATPDVIARIEAEVVQPSIAGMRKDGFPFVGLLFIGLMITPAGPKVLEYNVRFGDPETEAVLELLDDKTSLTEIMVACAERRLDSVNVSFKKGHSAVSIVLASEGYPGSYPKGKVITVGQVPAGVKVFHAGTSLSPNGELVTAGGRVIAVSAAAPTLSQALEQAYKGVEAVDFEGKQYRKDIAHRALTLAQTAATAEGMTYASAGVSVSNGNALVELIKPHAKRTRRTGCDASLGGFGGVFDLMATGRKDPVLVAGTDGVGTKLKVAKDVNKHDGVGIDLVAMSVNDLIVQGAEPLFFLDYFSTSHLDVHQAEQVIAGIAEGCAQSGCALIGGETAEMPGMYSDGEYDLAGFAVAVVERENLLPRLDLIEEGDVVLGLPSSGVHSNGFSLVRKIVAHAGLDLATSPCPYPSTSATIGLDVLTPTRLYVKTLLPLLNPGPTSSGIVALSHITGGGFTENIPRVMPSHLGVNIDLSSWTPPPIFSFLAKAGKVSTAEMCRTFNCGVGMVLVVKASKATEVVRGLKDQGEGGVVHMGEVTAGQGVRYTGKAAWAYD